MSDDHITCEKVIEELFRYLDGEVGDELGERIHEHLERCRDCFTRAEFERRLRDRVRAASETKAPDRLHQRLRQVMRSF